ncbi:Uncharacterised protein [Vibrio cholerae]|nr:Uncharacterised protein [Vibrio cholerae]
MGVTDRTVGLVSFTRFFPNWVDVVQHGFFFHPHFRADLLPR